MDVKLADGVTIVRIDHPPVNAFNLELVDDAVATVRSIRGSTQAPSWTRTSEQAGAWMKRGLASARFSTRSSDAQVIARQLISMLSPSRTGKLTLT